MKQLGRFCGWLLALIGLATLVLIILVHGNQYLLRRRAEHLLADVRSLTLRVSTYEDVRNITARWPDNWHQTGPCQRNHCDLEITLADPIWRHLVFFQQHQQIWRLYVLLGGRSAKMSAGIKVRDGIVWGKGISAYIEGPTFRTDEQPPVHWILIAEAGTAPPTIIRRSHPEYSVGGPSACTGCTAIRVLFTPYARPDDVNRLMGIDFSCITRWSPCKNEADIMPAAWDVVEANRREAVNQKRESEDPESSCTAERLRVLGREATIVALGTVHSINKTTDGMAATLNLTSELKSAPPRVFPTPGLPYPVIPQLGYPYPLPPKPPKRFTFPLPHSGDWIANREYIVFQNEDGTPDERSPCYAIPRTEENMRFVERGIVESRSDLSKD